MTASMTTQPTIDKDSPMTDTVTTPAPSTDLATYDPAGGTQAVVIGHHVTDFQEFAKAIAVSELLPDGLRGKPGNVFIALMQGLDLGLRPMQAINLIDVIKGKPCMSAQGMRALIVSAGHEINVIEWTDEKCVIEGRRKGQPDWRQASFTIEQAKTAGLNGDNWKKYPADMLLARATSRLAKAYFADATNGLSSVEELLDVAPVDRPTLAQVAAQRDGVDTKTGEVIDAVIVEPTDEEIRAQVLAAAGETCQGCGGTPPCKSAAACPGGTPADQDAAADLAAEAQQTFDADGSGDGS